VKAVREYFGIPDMKMHADLTPQGGFWENMKAGISLFFAFSFFSPFFLIFQKVKPIFKMQHWYTDRIQCASTTS
jgi:hypothetical protein